MFRKRERFERCDVPKPGPLRNVFAVVVLIVCLVSFGILCSKSWYKANQLNGLNSEELDDALYEQVDPTEPTGGRVWSDDDFSNVQIFLVDDINAEQPELKAAQIFVYDSTAEKATIVDLPINMKVWLKDSTSTLPIQFAEGGAEQALPFVTSADNVHVSHVIVASESFWDQVSSFKGSAFSAMFSDQTDDFATMTSDFDLADLLEFSERVQKIGYENIEHLNPPTWPETMPDGSEVSVVDWQELPTQLGIFVYPE